MTTIDKNELIILQINILRVIVERGILLYLSENYINRNNEKNKSQQPLQ